jgi:hypothetical protein
MARLSVALAVLAAEAAVARGQIWFDFVPVDSSGVSPGDDTLVPDFNDGSYFTFDLRVTHGATDALWAAQATATLDGPAVFFQHPRGGDLPADPGQIELYPALEFDSFFDVPSGDLVFDFDFPVNEPQRIEAIWYDIGNRVPGGGPYVIARYTAHWQGGPPTLLTVEGVAGSIMSGDLWYIGPFVVTIPEPSAFMLLAFGAATIFRRRIQPLSHHGAHDRSQSVACSTTPRRAGFAKTWPMIGGTVFSRSAS